MVLIRQYALTISHNSTLAYHVACQTPQRPIAPASSSTVADDGPWRHMPPDSHWNVPINVDKKEGLHIKYGNPVRVTIALRGASAQKQSKQPCHSHITIITIIAFLYLSNPNSHLSHLRSSRWKCRSISPFRLHLAHPGPRSRLDGLLGFGVCLQARKVCRDGLQQTDHATRLAGHTTVGTGHGLKRAMARHGVPNGLERNTVQPLQPGRRFFASLHQGQATGLVEPQPQKAQRAQRAQHVSGHPDIIGFHWIPMRPPPPVKS